MDWDLLHKRSQVAFTKFEQLPLAEKAKSGRILLEQAVLNEEHAFFVSMSKASPLVRGELAANMAYYWLLLGQPENAIEALRIGANSKDIPEIVRTQLETLLNSLDG